jgi:hypothetical protein
LSRQFKKNDLTERKVVSEAGSSRLKEFCVTQLKAQGVHVGPVSRVIDKKKRHLVRVKVRVADNAEAVSTQATTTETLNWNCLFSQFGNASAPGLNRTFSAETADDGQIIMVK